MDMAGWGGGGGRVRRFYDRCKDKILKLFLHVLPECMVEEVH